MAVRAGIQLCNRPEAWIDRLAVREGREATLADRLIAVDLGFVGLVHGARADVLSAQIKSIAELMFHAEAPKAARLDSPTHNSLVRNTMKGIRRTFGTAPGQKAATLTNDIRAMVDATDASTIGIRDRALVLLGFAGAFRRSELVGLDVDDRVFSKDGLTVTLRRSKVDQEGVGRKIGIPYGSNPETCPVRTMQAWIEQAAITAGPVFRSINRHGHVKAGRLSGIDVARVVKKLVDRAGLDASQYAGHSLRAGHATSAAIAGASERSIMNQTGHKSVQMVRRYIRDGNLFRENSAGKLGL